MEKEGERKKVRKRKDRRKMKSEKAEKESVCERDRENKKLQGSLTEGEGSVQLTSLH